MTDPSPAAQAASADSPFAVSASESGEGLVTVAVAGEIDLLTAPQVGTALREAQRDTTAVLLDLSAVNFLGSAGLSVLVDAARRADQSQGRFAVLVTVHAVARAIEVTGLDAALTVFDDITRAREHLMA